MSYHNSGSRGGYRDRRGGFRGGSSSYGNSGHRGGGSGGGSGDYNRYSKGAYGSNGSGHSSHQQGGRKPFVKRGGHQPVYQSAYQSAYQSQNFQTSGYTQQNNRHNETSHSSFQQFQLWMGGLDPTWTEESISAIWAAFGEKPTAVKIMKDKFNTSKPSYCFVSFATQEAMAAAMNKNGLAIPGSTRVFKLNWASGGLAAQAASSVIPKGDSRVPLKNDYSIFIGDLAPDATEELIMSKFEARFPDQVKQVKIMYDPMTGANKGFGFIRFHNQDTKTRALKEMNGVVIGSRAIRVGHATGTNTIPPTGAQETESHEFSKIHIPQPQPTLNQFTDPNNSTLIVKGLSSKFTENEVAEHLIAFGDIVFCRLSPDFQSATVKFYLRASAENALLFLHGETINECQIEITWGSEKELTSGQKYEPAKKAPLIYSSFDVYPVRLDKLNESQVSELLSSGIDGSSPLPAGRANELYVKAKLQKESSLELALY
ncbi:uncharacterized protein RJT20DRAFT_99650 [Scheffersomyces xylosifermentans]|uniref:uncharacterized protein n=1 Tax=Scheffersomyces xylosifermentans TaxID=1304137 RepID=UPI00315D83B2